MLKMNTYLSIFAILVLLGCADTTDGALDIEMQELKDSNALTPCSKAWMVFIDDSITTQDENQHGPDIGSAEWKSTIEYKLNVKNNPEVPDQNSQDWCIYVDEKMKTFKQG